MKINSKLWISIIFSLFFVVLIVNHVDFDKMKKALETANYWQFSPNKGYVNN